MDVTTTENNNNNNNIETELNKGQIVDENGRIYEPTSETEREYYEGFLARPKIPRTPQT